MNGNKPIEVKILAVLFYIRAASNLILGFGALFGMGILNYLFNQTPILGVLSKGVFIPIFFKVLSLVVKIPLLGFLTLYLNITIGIFFLLFAVFSFFMGMGLWKAKNWSRISAMILYLLGIAGGVFALTSTDFLSGAVTIVLCALVGGYLLFSSRIKEAFR